MPISLSSSLDLSSVIAAAITERLGHATEETAKSFVEAMHTEMLSGKSGRAYGSHIASAPGESPANWTGKELSTAGYSRTGPLSAEAHIGGEEAPYAAILEMGSAGGRVAARPLCVPLAEEYRKIFPEMLTAAIKEVLE